MPDVDTSLMTPARALSRRSIGTALAGLVALVIAAGAPRALPLEITASWLSAEGDSSRSAAWGDWDNDGDLDLAVGNQNRSNRVYVNGGTGLSPVAGWSSTESSDQTLSIAWGDVDGDGDLDLAVGNDRAPNRVYTSDGTGLESLGVN